MKITKYIHSCLLVETPDRVALFDPGVYSAEALDVAGLARLDDIFVTHEHPDHFGLEIIKKLGQKFPNVRITSTRPVVDQLAAAGIKAANTPPEGVSFFESPHAHKAPLMPQGPEEVGIHYLDVLSHPGDSHAFRETKDILALPVTAPWGTAFDAISLAVELKPKHVLPIHDWHWHDQARQLMYGRFEKVLAQEGIAFYKLETGLPVEINP